MAEVIELDIRAKSQQAQGELDKARKRLIELQRLAANVTIGDTGQAERYGAAISLANQRVKALKDSLKEARLDERLAPQIDDIKGGIDRAARSAIDLRSVLNTAGGFLFAGGIQSVIAGVVGAFKDGVNGAREFQKTIAEINSILPQNAKLTESTTGNIQALARSYGVDAISQAKAYYQAVSAGAEDSADAIKILRSSNAAALATQSDLTSVATVLTATLNAYAGTNLDAATATDILVKSIDDGSVNFQELTNQLARVTPTAAALKVPLDEVVGSIAFLTKVGFTTEQATTSLAAALSSIVKPTQEAQETFQRLGGSLAGVSLGADTVAKSGGLVQFIQKVNKEAEGSSDLLTKIFGDERATKAVLAISGNLRDYAGVLASVKDSAGATARANQELSKTFDFQAKRFEELATAAKIQFGTVALPILSRFIDLATKAGKLLFGDGPSLATDRQARLNALSAEYNVLVDKNNQLKTIAEGLFSKEGARTEATKKIAENEQRLNEILTERRSLRAAGATPVPEAPPAPPTTTGTSPLTAEERRIQSEITAIKLEGEAARAAIDLDTRNARAAAAGEEFLSRSEIELQQSQLQIEAVYAAELEKNKLIADSKAERLANDIAFQKKTESLAKANATFENRAARESVALAQKETDAKTSLAFAGANLAAAIAKDGSKEQFIIQKAAAIAQSIVAGIQARALALASPPGPPATLPLAATVTGIAAANTAAIAASAIKGFAAGGIIGNPIGATTGQDNRLATVRDGEMILNADQQKKLFDMIQGGGMAGSIIIQVDGREIARAVRDQVQQGYKIQ